MPKPTTEADCIKAGGKWINAECIIPPQGVTPLRIKHRPQKLSAIDKMLLNSEAFSTLKELLTLRRANILIAPPLPPIPPVMGSSASEPERGCKPGEICPSKETVMADLSTRIDELESQIPEEETMEDRALRLLIKYLDKLED